MVNTTHFDVVIKILTQGYHDIVILFRSHSLSVFSPNIFYRVLSNTDPLILAILVMSLITLWCYFSSIVRGNYSQVDRLWSILPPFYAWLFIGCATISSLIVHPADPHQYTVTPRAILMTILTTLWGIRLTFNFWRKGGYSADGEDYRWIWLRQRVSPLWFQILNLVFIAVYQNILIFLFSIPIYAAITTPLSGYSSWNIIDILATVIFITALIGETVADQQQWIFQTEKHRRINAHEPLSGEYAVGFLRTGLWRYSRHPNFFCEMVIWWAYYLFTVSASVSAKMDYQWSLWLLISLPWSQWLNWMVSGTLLLTLLFQGSTPLTEYITHLKYPQYRQYQQTTSRLIPCIPRSTTTIRKKHD